jgi:ribosomal protein S18 acetylase RimI-like enzyme
MSEVHVRRATPQDEEAVLQLWQEMMDYHAHLDPRFQPSPDGKEHFHAALKEWMDDDSRCVLVAVADGEVIGYIIGRLAENPPVFALRRFGYVTDICVAPPWRRLGVGRKLFAALQEWFRQQGLTVVQLNVAALNPTSQAFWRAMGFQDFLNQMWLDLA